MAGVWCCFIGQRHSCDNVKLINIETVENMPNVWVHVQHGSDQTEKFGSNPPINGDQVSTQDVIACIYDVASRLPSELQNTYEINSLVSRVSSLAGTWMSGGGAGHNALSTHNIAHSQYHIDIEISGNVYFH